MQIRFSLLYHNWARWCLFNLLLVAIAGLVIRSKIIFPLAFIQQKNLLHGHSHFAFGGWVTAALMVAITAILYPEGPDKKLRRLFYVQMIASYGMLLTFPIMGYKLPSIFFSTVTIVVSILFCFYTWKSLATLPFSVHCWLRTALLCNMFAALGTFALAYLMATGSHSQELTIGSLYFFLHFQYNGWFFFSCTGLFFWWLSYAEVPMNQEVIKSCWRCITIALVPAFFLSLLWMKIPVWIFALAIIAAILQIIALIIFLREWYSLKNFMPLKPMAKYCMGISLIALSVKFFLQALSSFPALSIYAFGYRSLVIAFLHLVLLGFVSLFIIGYFLQMEFIPARGIEKGIYVFSLGIILNETLLIIQGISAIAYIVIPFTSELLWLIAVLMMGGIFWLNRKSV